MENKLYSDGLIIKTSIDSKIQFLADQSLLEGIISYDKTTGWRGVITNTNIEKFLMIKNIINQ